MSVNHSFNLQIDPSFINKLIFSQSFLVCGLLHSPTSIFFQLLNSQFPNWTSAFFLDSISISIIQLINEIGIEIRKKKAEAEGKLENEIQNEKWWIECIQPTKLERKTEFDWMEFNQWWSARRRLWMNEWCMKCVN